ncbi:MAG: tRNA (N(6)-L-threonylcarbamoyladenosine(37)-C(2))-methylthiotransferase MtaB [Candidatus Zixiibacteriota bacterium]
MTARPRVSFYTLGCRLNQAETALMAESFRAHGYDIAEHGDPVNVAVINTCSVTERADQRCRQEIRKVRRRSPNATVCAVGCYAQSDPKTVASILGVDLVVGTDRKYTLASLLEGRLPHGVDRRFPHGVIPRSEATRDMLLTSVDTDDPRRGGSETRPTPVINTDGPSIHVSRRPDNGDFDYPVAGYYPHSTRANIKIQDGCEFCCAFCLIPRVRGEARSRPLTDIIAEGEELVRRGHKELVITGVNIGTYDFQGKSITDVACGLSAIDGVQRVRVSSIEPSTVPDDLLHWMAESDKACRHLHLPLQSGDNAVLAGMKRVYTVSEYAQFVNRAKSMMPELGLGTDIIVGFPGETEREFQNSRSFIDEMPFSYLHVFSYSGRPKTASIHYDGQNDPRTVKDRADRMQELAERKKEQFFAEHVGRTVDVLFESVDDDGWRKGFTGSYLRVGAAPDAVGENEIATVKLGGRTPEFCFAA